MWRLKGLKHWRECSFMSCVGEVQTEESPCVQEPGSSIPALSLPVARFPALLQVPHCKTRPLSWWFPGCLSFLEDAVSFKCFKGHAVCCSSNSARVQSWAKMQRCHVTSRLPRLHERPALGTTRPVPSLWTQWLCWRS